MLACGEADDPRFAGVVRREADASTCLDRRYCLPSVGDPSIATVAPLSNEEASRSVCGRWLVASGPDLVPSLVYGHSSNGRGDWRGEQRRRMQAERRQDRWLHFFFDREDPLLGYVGHVELRDAQPWGSTLSYSPWHMDGVARVYGTADLDCVGPTNWGGPATECVLPACRRDSADDRLCSIEEGCAADRLAERCPDPEADCTCEVWTLLRDCPDAP